MKTARCKFVVRSVEIFNDTYRKVNLSTQYDKSIPEDVAFAKATPCGDMKIDLTNPAVFDVFTPGNEVYVDVTVVPSERSGI